MSTLSDEVHEDKMIGVLNFDSPLGIDQTMFDQREVVLRALAEASKLAHFLPQIGYLSR